MLLALFRGALGLVPVEWLVLRDLGLCLGVLFSNRHTRLCEAGVLPEDRSNKPLSSPCACEPCSKIPAGLVTGSKSLVIKPKRAGDLLGVWLSRLSAMAFYKNVPRTRGRLFPHYS